jgi:5-methylcytosine-specific restriction endonuclease McrA
MRDGSYWFKYIKELVLQRDEYRCQICGSGIEKRLCIHHKDGSGDLPMYQPSNNKSENLITLCFSCHGKIHAGTIKYE